MAESAPVTVPTLVALMICDQVIDDRLTHKKSAIGLFNTVLVGSVPTQVQQIVVMASLTEISARSPIELRLVRDADNDILFATRGFVEAPNPLATVDLIFTMHGIQLRTVGQYAFEVLSNGEILGRRRFHVTVRPAGPTPPVPPTAPGPTPPEA